MSQGLIQGSMREAPLPDIIQLVSQGGKSGCFHVSEEPKRAKIYLKDGRIAHAVSNDAEGLDAVYEVALWLDGRYHFEEGDADIPVTITKSNATILMEMHRRMDEWRVINQKISSLDLYPVSMLLPGETPSGVNPREARLLSIITGCYTVAELAEVLQKPVLSVAKDLYGLMMAGHVNLKGVRSGKPPVLPADMKPSAAVPEPIAKPVPVPAPPPPPAPAPAPEAAFIPVPTISQPEPVIPAALPKAASPLVLDPVKMAKLTNYVQRIIHVAKTVLPQEHQDMVNRLHAKATQQIVAGEGAEAVKNLALAISRGAMDAGCDPDTAKTLNIQLKTIFTK